MRKRSKESIMNVKLILPALVEAAAPGLVTNERLRRPIKYSLFPPLGLAQLAAFWIRKTRSRSSTSTWRLLTTYDAPDLVACDRYSKRCSPPSQSSAA
jgi:hypothetical protein